MGKAICALAAVMAAGCYGSSLAGDAGTDAVPDAAPDAADVAHEAPDAPCVPASGIEVGFDISGYPVYGEIDVEEVCDIADWWEDEGDGVWGIMLACRSDEGDVVEHLLTVTGSPHVLYPYPPEEDLLLRYVRYDSWPQGRWFTLGHMEGWILAAGAEAWTVAPPDHDAGEWYSPIEMWVIAGICPAEPTTCGPQERLALEVRLDEAHGVIMDGNVGWASSLMGSQVLVHVESAWEYLDLACDGPPSSWYDFVAVVPPSM